MGLLDKFLFAQKHFPQESTPPTLSFYPLTLTPLAWDAQKCFARSNGHFWAAWVNAGLTPCHAEQSLPLKWCFPACSWQTPHTHLCTAWQPPHSLERSSASCRMQPQHEPSPVSLPDLLHTSCLHHYWFSHQQQFNPFHTENPFMFYCAAQTFTTHPYIHGNPTTGSLTVRTGCCAQTIGIPCILASAGFNCCPALTFPKDAALLLLCRACLCSLQAAVSSLEPWLMNAACWWPLHYK